MTTPPDDLQASMLARASDLAHFMLTRGRDIAVASGTTANGHPCTMILAIGEDAKIAAQVGARLLDEIERRNAAEKRASGAN